MASEFEKAKREAEAQAAALDGERVELEKRLRWIGERRLALAETIECLSKLVNPGDVGDVKVDRSHVLGDKPGLKEACIRVLQEFSPRALKLAEIKKHLESVGYDFTRYQNPTGALATTLGRLVPEFAQIVSVYGKKTYTYKESTNGANNQPVADHFGVSAHDPLSLAAPVSGSRCRKQT